MKKFLYNAWHNWISAQDEMAAMGMWHICSSSGYYLFVDKDQYQRYLKSKQKEKQNEH